MFFKGDLYITDPGYISKEDDWMDEYGFDIDNFSINCPEFSDYLIEDTGEGDGEWSVYELPDAESLGVSRIYNMIDTGEYKIKNYPVLGEFAADAGMSCVVYKNEVNAYNPDWKKDFKATGLYTEIDDFEGEVFSFFDRNDCLHFVGIGNKSFFTA